MSGKICRYIVLILLMITTASQAAYAGCLTEKQVRADQVRFVQASLTAAAMQCRGNNRDQILKIYNYFISHYRTDLMDGLINLRLYYQDEMNNEHSHALDRHITLQINYVLSVGQGLPEFCNEILANTTSLVSEPTIDSREWLSGLPIGYEPIVKACPSQPFPQLASSR
jgi:hypothetical protein